MTQTIVALSVMRSLSQFPPISPSLNASLSSIKTSMTVMISHVHTVHMYYVTHAVMVTSVMMRCCSTSCQPIRCSEKDLLIDLKNIHSLALLSVNTAKEW